jgi:dihydroflavonol-4-reductase
VVDLVPNVSASDRVGRRRGLGYGPVMLLVTGATGFVGSAVVKVLVEAGLPVRATVRDEARASILPEVVERAAADLADEESLVAAMRGCDGVFHLAAARGPQPEDTPRSNVDGTLPVLSAARRTGVRRFVYCSSSAAIVTADGLVSEQATGPTAMADPYSTTKCEAEGLVLAAAAEGLDACVVNPTMIYGPSPFGPSSYNSLFLAAARGEVTEIVDAPVGWVLAEDVGRAHLLAYEKGEAGRRYVISGEVAGFGRVLHRFAELVGSPHRVRTLPPGTTLPADAALFARRSEVYGKLGAVRIDDAQARALGFAARELEEGLSITACWISERYPIAG